MDRTIFLIYDLLSRSSSPAERSLGLQITPPFAPPPAEGGRGHISRSSGRQGHGFLQPSCLDEPDSPPSSVRRHDDIGIRYPWNALIVPSSIRTVTETCSSCMDIFRIASTNGKVQVNGAGTNGRFNRFEKIDISSSTPSFVKERYHQHMKMRSLMTLSGLC
jgi:hypothetical protein